MYSTICTSIPQVWDASFSSCSKLFSMQERTKNIPRPIVAVTKLNFYFIKYTTTIINLLLCRICDQPVFTSWYNIAVLTRETGVLIHAFEEYIGLNTDQYRHCNSDQLVKMSC